MSTEYVGMVFYDLPMQNALQRKNYTRIRKFLLNKGYYALQESLYIINVTDLTTIANIEIQLQALALDLGSIRSLVLTREQFKKMKILSGDMTLAEKIMRQEVKIVEF